VRWALACTLLAPLAGGEALLWALTRHSAAGRAWAQHALPRLGWLLAAARALYCDAPRAVGAAASEPRRQVDVWLEVRPVPHHPLARHQPQWQCPAC
jgi:hypothetical protein